MSKKTEKSIFIGLVLLLLNYGCKPPIYEKTTQTSLALDSTYANFIPIEKTITPFKESLEKEMNEVLVLSAEEFPKEKGKPETKLGNLVADLSMEIAQKMYDGNIDFCLLNFGGLRTSLPKGEITKGKIFELMPFENELVVVTISKDSISSLIEYLKKVNGQPISGIKLNFKKIGSSNIDNVYGGDWIKITNENVKILTSDYLANGGDNMKFFFNPINYEKVGIKLRDAIIQYCVEQHAQGKQLSGKIEGRIVYE